MMQKTIIVLTILFVCVASSEWILKDLRTPRVRPAVAQVDNKIYIAGGEITGGVETDSIEVLNTDRFEFEEINISLPSPRQRFTAVPFGSKILFTGGAQNNIDVYDTSSNSWTVLTIPDLANVNVTFAGTLDNQLVLATSGGEALFIDPNSGKVLTSVTYGNVWDVPPTRTFLQAPNYNGRIYVANGADIVGLNSTSSQPLIARTIRNAVVNHMFVLGGYLYISDIAANQFYFYQLNSSRWDARLLLGRTDYSIAAVGSSVYVLGGALVYPNNTRTDYTTGFTFDTRYLSLSSPIDLKVPRSQMTPFIAPNAALFIGGLTDADQYSSTIDIIYDGELKPPTATPIFTRTPHATTSGSAQLLMNLVLLIATVSVCLFN